MSIGDIATTHTGLDRVMIERDAGIMRKMMLVRDESYGVNSDRYYGNTAKIRDMVGRLQRERGRMYSSMVINLANDQPKPKIGDIYA